MIRGSTVAGLGVLDNPTIRCRAIYLVNVTTTVSKEIACEITVAVESRKITRALSQIATILVASILAWGTRTGCVCIIDSKPILRADVVYS